jgi:hypothetical protein
VTSRCITLERLALSLAISLVLLCRWIGDTSS